MGKFAWEPEKRNRKCSTKWHYYSRSPCDQLVRINHIHLSNHHWIWGSYWIDVLQCISNGCRAPTCIYYSEHKSISISISIGTIHVSTIVFCVSVCVHGSGCYKSAWDTNFETIFMHTFYRWTVYIRSCRNSSTKTTTTTKPLSNINSFRSMKFLFVWWCVSVSVKLNSRNLVRWLVYLVCDIN